MNKYHSLVDGLSSKDADARLENLGKLNMLVDSGEIERPVNEGHVNNHIHTAYSFSPYFPAKALWMAYTSGLTTAGIIDHDSISGAREFIKAGKIIGMATTIGAECRVDFSGTPLSGRKINNPDQKTIAYVTLHGIPHTKIDEVVEFFKPYITERNKRNKAMVENINKLVSSHGILLHFENDVLPLSQFHEGGSVTERHILYALALKLIDRFGIGESLITFLRRELRLNISPKTEYMLLDLHNPFYSYDLLGLLKGEMVESFYIDAKAECPDVKEFIALSERIGAISAYAYLGDVGDSVTGDKKTQKFEDDYIEELFEVLSGLGFDAVTYMPSRNTLEQLKRVKALCDRHGLFQISGEDINSPRQCFVCKAMENSEFDNLVDSTWALIGHEQMATEDISKGMFSPQTIAKHPSLEERIKIYMDIGLKLSGM